MIVRDALDIRIGTTPVKKRYQGSYKVWDRNKIALEGYCKQNTTEGINLIEPKIATGTTKNGITIINNGDGSYIINGTATTGTDIRLDQSIPAGTDNLKNYTAGTYSLSCNELKTGLRLVLMQNQTWAKLIEMQYTNTPITKYIEDTNNVFFYLYIDGGTTYNNYIIHPQLEKSSTVHDWEPYTGGQPSPNPDYEQPIEVMQGRQVVNIKSKNELNYDLEPENKYYDMNGQPVTISGAVYVNQTINLLANTTYTFSYEEKIGDAIVRLCEYKEDGTFIKRTLIQNNNDSIKLNSETSYVITSTNKAPTSMFIKPQLEEGSTASPWVPYKNEQYTVDLKSKNWFDVNQEITADILSAYGVSWTINNDGTISTSGTNTAQYKRIEWDITLPAGTYAFNGCPSGGSVNGYSSLIEKGGTGIFDTGSGNTFTLDTETTIKYYPVRVGSDTVNFNGLVFKPMIRLATIEDDTYEPYYDYKLAGIGDYKDNFYTDKGKWYKHETVYKERIISDKVSYNNEYQGIYQYRITTSKGVKYVNDTEIYTKSNYFKGSSQSEWWTKDNSITVDFGTIFITTSKYSDIASFNEFIDNNEVYMYYALTTPTVEEITAPTLINQLNALYQAM